MSPEPGADSHASGPVPESDGAQLAAWTIEAMADPDLGALVGGRRPRDRQLVRSAVSALRDAQARLT